jgi:hypothetical protein
MARRAVQESWEEARAKCQAALGELVQGKPEAFKALWSRSDDVVIMGAFGGFERGGRRLPTASTGPAPASGRVAAVSKTS